MKKTTKKAIKRSSVTVKDLQYLPAEITKLNNRIEELEQQLAKVKLSGSKEPETFEDCVNLHKEGWISTGHGGFVKEHKDWVKRDLLHGVSTPSEKRAKQLAAIAKMMTVADALNETPSYFPKDKGSAKGTGYFFRITCGSSPLVASYAGHYGQEHDEMIAFDSEAKARKAIKILGEDTIKTAFGL